MWQQTYHSQRARALMRRAQERLPEQERLLEQRRREPEKHLQQRAQREQRTKQTKPLPLALRLTMKRALLLVHS
jgi:hypothetical protein